MAKSCVMWQKGPAAKEKPALNLPGLRFQNHFTKLNNKNCPAPIPTASGCMCAYDNACLIRRCHSLHAYKIATIHFFKMADATLTAFTSRVFEDFKKWLFSSPSSKPNHAVNDCTTVSILHQCSEHIREKESNINSRTQDASWWDICTRTLSKSLKYCMQQFCFKNRRENEREISRYFNFTELCCSGMEVAWHRVTYYEHRILTLALWGYTLDECTSFIFLPFWSCRCQKHLPARWATERAGLMTQSDSLSDSYSCYHVLAITSRHGHVYGLDLFTN